MVNGRIPNVCSKTYVTPRRPYEKARLDQELKIIGAFGLRNKREVWRVKYTLAKIRKAARELLTLEEKDPKRLFEGEFFESVVFVFYTLNAPTPRSNSVKIPIRSARKFEGAYKAPLGNRQQPLPWFCLCRKLRTHFYITLV